MALSENPSTEQGRGVSERFTTQCAHSTKAKSLLDIEQAREHVRLVGIPEGEVDLRALHWDGRAQELSQAFGPYWLEELEGLQQRGYRLYLNAGGERNDAAVVKIPCLFVEFDGLTLQQTEWWMGECAATGLPDPTLSLTTWRNGSVHYWWRLGEPCTDIERWRRLMKRLTVSLGSDTSCTNPSRVMRLAGSAYWQKAGEPDQGKALGQATILDSDEDATTTLGEMEAWVDGQFAARPDLAFYAKEVAALAARGERAGLPQEDSERPLFKGKLRAPRPQEQIEAALDAIPRRESGTGGPRDYSWYRGVLLGLRDALYRLAQGEETERIDIANQQAVVLMEAHSPSRECNWKIQQVLSSSLWMNEGVFWKRAKEAGWKPPAPIEEERPTYRELITEALAAEEADDMDRRASVRALLMSEYRVRAAEIQRDIWNLLLESRLPKTTTEQRDFTDLSSVEETTHLVPGFIPRHDQAHVQAVRGAGKTIAGLSISEAVVDGLPFLDRGEPAARGRVLFLASDSPLGTVKGQMADLGLALNPAFIEGHPEQRFHIRGHDAIQGTSGWKATVAGVLWLIRVVQEKRIDLVVIDNAKQVCMLTDTDYTDNNNVGALLTVFQRLVCPHAAVLWLNQVGTADGWNAGAKAWSELVSIHHTIERVGEGKPKGRLGDDKPAPPVGARLWRCVKSRLSGDEREFHYLLDPGEGLRVTAEVEIVGNCRDAVVEVLYRAHQQGTTELTKKGLIEEVQARHGRSSKTVANTVTQMQRGRDPEIVRRGRGRYALAPALLQRMKVTAALPQ